MKQDIFQLHALLEETHWWFTGRREIMRRIVDWAVPGSGGDLTAVDVGCGTGANVDALTDRFRCVGVDPSPEGVHLASARFPAVEFVCGYAPEDVLEPLARADLILLMDVLEHVPDDFRTLSEILRVAKPGATVLITVPAHESLWSRHDVNLHHYRRYGLERLRRVWRDLPVSAALVSYFNSRLYPVAVGARALSRIAGRSLGRAGTDVALPPGPVNALLRRTFAGEAKRLLSVAGGRTPSGYRTGLSLMAVLRRESGDVTPADRPPDVAPDRHDPEEWGA